MFPSVPGRRPVLLDDAPQRIGGGSFLRREPTAREESSVRPGGTLPSLGSRTSTFEREPDSFARSDRSDEAPEEDIVVQLSTTTERPAAREGASRPSSTSDDLFREAANPVPPHLRAAGPLLRFEPAKPVARSGSSPTSRSVCASCSKVVVSLRMSGPCPKCMRPICNDCLRDAFVTHGHGWCVDCLSDTAPETAN